MTAKERTEKLREKIAYKLLELKGWHLPEYWQDVKHIYLVEADQILLACKESGLVFYVDTGKDLYEADVFETMEIEI